MRLTPSPTPCPTTMGTRTANRSNGALQATDHSLDIILDFEPALVSSPTDDHHNGSATKPKIHATGDSWLCVWPTQAAIKLLQTDLKILAQSFRRGEQPPPPFVAEEWQAHVLSNLPFYTHLVPLFLSLLQTRVSSRGDVALTDLLKARRTPPLSVDRLCHPVSRKSCRNMGLIKGSAGMQALHTMPCWE